jgi:hypothetical protein
MLEQIVNIGGSVQVKRFGRFLNVEYAFVSLYAKVIFTVAANVEHREATRHTSRTRRIRAGLGSGKAQAACGGDRGNCTGSLQKISALH